ncbi:MAG: GNAT family N-acetyltransferase, partial [Acidovorax sp.]
GFERIGALRSVGFKKGRWLDTVLMQRPLGAGDGALPGDTSSAAVSAPREVA